MLMAVMQFSFQDFVQIQTTVYAYIALEFCFYRCYQNLPCIVTVHNVMSANHYGTRILDVYTITFTVLQA